VLGLAIDEQHGGSGGSLTDVGIFSVEAGRALCPNIVHSTVHAALAVDWLGGPRARATWLPAMASGATLGTTALWSPRDASNATPSLHARPEGDGWRVWGVADFVADADLAELIVVTAEADGDTRAFVVETASSGISVEALALMGGHPRSRFGSRMWWSTKLRSWMSNRYAD
jgi:alkylation response protein AidB-like acyl-CoA dehydrogenase